MGPWLCASPPSTAHHGSTPQAGFSPWSLILFPPDSYPHLPLAAAFAEPLGPGYCLLRCGGSQVDGFTILQSNEDEQSHACRRGRAGQVLLWHLEPWPSTAGAGGEMEPGRCPQEMLITPECSSAGRWEALVELGQLPPSTPCCSPPREVTCLPRDPWRGISGSKLTFWVRWFSTVGVTAWK